MCATLKPLKTPPQAGPAHAAVAANALAACTRRLEVRPPQSARGPPAAMLGSGELAAALDDTVLLAAEAAQGLVARRGAWEMAVGGGALRRLGRVPGLGADALHSVGRRLMHCCPEPVYSNESKPDIGSEVD